MSEHSNTSRVESMAAAPKKAWAAPVLTQLGIPSTESGNFTNINENIFFFFGGMCRDMFICS